MWRKEFEPLDLRGGSISFICNDDEDMIEITYPDGMLIDVGKAQSTGLYYVTVVSSNNPAGWKAPLYELPFATRADLVAGIQKAIDLFRMNQ